MDESPREPSSRASGDRAGGQAAKAGGFPVLRGGHRGSGSPSNESGTGTEREPGQGDQQSGERRALKTQRKREIRVVFPAGRPVLEEDSGDTGGKYERPVGDGFEFHD
ncbi:hypothetical protein GN956_G11407 [Arapaima gigas]